MSIMIPDELFDQTVMPQGQTAYNNINRAAPGDFGVQSREANPAAGPTGREATSAGGPAAPAGGPTAPQMLDATNVNDVYAHRFDPACRSLYANFLNLSGKDAVVQLPAAQQQMLDLAEDTWGALPNGSQQGLFNDMVRRRMNSDFNAMSQHAAASLTRWQADTADAISGTFGKRIGDNICDYDKVAGEGGLIYAIKRMNEVHGELTGEDASISSVRAAGAIDRGLSDAILNVAGSNPEAAKSLYDKYEPYLSSGDVKDHVLNNLMPAVRQQQNVSVYSDAMTRFNLTDSGSNIDVATAHVMDPENYPGLGRDQRGGVAQALRGEWNNLRQAEKNNQSLADNNFTGAVARGQIAGLALQTWRDPKTGLAPSDGILQAAVDRGANPSEPGRSDPDTLFSLAGHIANGDANGRGPINEAWLGNLITSRDFRDLTSLYDTAQDPATSRGFDYATAAFNVKYAGPTAPNGVNAAALKLFPSYLLDLNNAICDQDLKGAQIRDAANKMLADIANLLPAAAPPREATPAGGPPARGDTNTSRDTNAGTNVLDSNGSPGQITGAQGDAAPAVAVRDAEEPPPWTVGDLLKETARESADLPLVIKRELQGYIVPVDHAKPEHPVYYFTSDKQPFLAPVKADWADVYNAGNANGRDLLAAAKALGHFGTYDFQRDEKKNLYYDAYKHAANYAVGVYLCGAGFSLEETKALAGRFAHVESSNAGDPEQITWWIKGWNDANSRKLPEKSNLIDPGFSIA